MPNKEYSLTLGEKETLEDFLDELGSQNEHHLNYLTEGRYRLEDVLDLFDEGEHIEDPLITAVSEVYSHLNDCHGCLTDLGESIDDLIIKLNDQYRS